MSKKNWVLPACVILLAIGYAVYFTDWFKPKTLQIFHTARNLHPQLQRGGAMPSLIFGLNAPVSLTEIKVVPLAAFQANPDARPLWHLVSVSNSIPLQSFYYGQPVRGLEPSVPGTRPERLESNVRYRLLVTAGKYRGQHDFELSGPSTASPAGGPN
jgi:hypothetical protein